MVRYDELCKVEIWTAAQLCAATSATPPGREQIVIPCYHRGLVWTSRMQRDLITSLQMRYPIGSVCLHDTGMSGATRRYELVDGLQRIHAIRLHLDNPNQHYPVDDVDEKVAATLATRLGFSGANAHRKTRVTIAEWVRSRKGFRAVDDWTSADLALSLAATFVDADVKSEAFRSAFMCLMTGEDSFSLLARFLAEVEARADISGVRIPVFVHRGDRRDLPDILKLLH